MSNQTIRPVVPSALSGALIGVLMSVSASAGTLYRWTDAEGQRHMETIIPADQAKLGYEVLDDRTFRVLKRVGRELNEEELAAAVVKQEAVAKAKQAEEIAARHDRTLLATYMSVDDMQMTRNGQLRTLESNIETTLRTQERLKSNLDDLIGSAASYERDGRPIPQKAEENIANVREQIERQDQIIAGFRDKQRQITDQFAVDIGRFKELKGIVDADEPTLSAELAPPPVDPAME